jgi:hypothetical protein
MSQQACHTRQVKSYKMMFLKQLKKSPNKLKRLVDTVAQETKTKNLDAFFNLRPGSFEDFQESFAGKAYTRPPRI